MAQIANSISTDAGERLIDDRQLAAMIGWSPKTPSNLRRKGLLKIPFIRIGGRTVRYRMRDVNVFMDKNTNRPASAVA